VFRIGRLNVLLPPNTSTISAMPKYATWRYCYAIWHLSQPSYGGRLSRHSCSSAALLTALLPVESDRWTPVESHICQNRADTPNFLHAALDTTARAPFFKERRMKFAEPTTLHRKSGIWGTRHSLTNRP
jgi:hypothetical protein